MRKLIAAVATAVCLVPALAFAADPAKNSAFRWCTDGGDRCPFAFETTKTGRYIKEIRAYNDCARVPAEFPRLRVRNGKFAKSGTVTDVIGQKLTYTFQGRFTRPRKAVGTYEIDRRGCNSQAQKFVARRTGKAQPGA